MRKRTIKNMCSTVFWHLLYFLPIILTAIICLGCFQGDWFTTWNEVDGDFTNFPFYSVLYNLLYEVFSINDSNIIYTTLEQIFGLGGYLPLFRETTVIFYYFTYYIGVYLLHLMVDFILFIPKLCHKWLNTFTRTEECD